MRSCILALMISLAVCTLADDRGETTSSNATLEDVVMEYMSVHRKYGSRHPKTLALRKDVETRIDIGERIDLSRMDAKLTGYFREFQLAKQKLSIRHPQTQESLHKILIATKLLTYEPEYFANNWTTILTKILAN